MKRNVCMVLAACAAVWGAVAQALPDGWIDVPFGTYSAGWEGGTSYDAVSGTFTVAGSGNDLSGNANDGGRFVFQPMLGDCEVIAEIRRPVSEGAGFAARAGLLIRQRNDRGSLFSFFGRRHGADGNNPNGNLLSSSARRVLMTAPEVLNRTEFAEEWITLRLIRQGDVTRAFYLEDDAWQFYQTYTVPMGEAVNAGIVVSRHSSNTAQLMTNEFRQVAARQLVSVQTNAVAGLDVTWVTDLPGISNGWTYTYALTRTAEGGAPEAMAQGLSVASFTDLEAVPGVTYRYAVTAAPAPTGLDTPPDVAVGTSGAVRLPASETNLVQGLPQGLFAAYYAPVAAVVPSVTRVESSVTNVMTGLPAGMADGFRAVFNASLSVETTDTYTFLTDSDDGVRLWVNETLVLDNWYNDRWKGSSMPVRLQAGRVAAFRAEYYQNTGARAFSLMWRRTGDAAAVPVPTEAFAPVPLPWRHADVGDTLLNGNAQFDAGQGTVTVTACGNDFEIEKDVGHMVWRDVSGDFDITARLDSLTGSGCRWAGIAARAGLAPDAPGLVLRAVPTGGEYIASALARGEAGAASSSLATVGTGVTDLDPLWLRVARTGLKLSVWFRADASAEWTLTGTMNLPFGTGTLYAGPVASSADDALSAQAVFGGMQSAVVASESILPAHDAFLRANWPTEHYGTNTELLIKRTMGGAGDNTQREVFMRFDVAGRAEVRSAVLRLYLQGRDANPADQDVMLRAFHDLHWTETEAMWDNAPGGLRLPTVFLAGDDPTVISRTLLPSAAGQHIEFDVSDAVRKAARGTGDLTFNLFGTVPVGNASITFASKEHATADRRPALILRYDAPSGVAASRGMDVGSVAVTWNTLPGALGYNVYRAATAAGPFTLAGTTVQTLFSDTGLTSGQEAFYRVSAMTADGETALSPAAVRAVAAEAAGTVMYAAEDTWVQGNGQGNGDHSNDQNGANTSLVIKYNAGDQSFHREAYLLFTGIEDLAQAERVVLRVTPSEQNSGSTLPMQFIRLPSNNWSEATVSFNNPPPGHVPPTPIIHGLHPKDRISAQAVPVNTPMDVDVTEMVREATRVNADGKLSICVIRTDPDGGSYNFSLYSKENTNTARKPQLIYTFGRPQPPTLADAGGYATLTWAPYRGATGYVVRRAEAEAGPYAVIGNTPATSLLDMDAEAGTVYWYTLAAITAGGETEPSLSAPGSVDFSEAREPLADTMIESNGGTTTDTNHGTAATLNLKRSPIREDFFKFDVLGLDNVARARFRVNASATSTLYGPVNIIVRHGDFGDWPENLVTYNEPPDDYRPPSISTAAKGANEVTRILVPTRDSNGNRANWLEADVTDAVRQAARNGTRYLTLFLTGDDTLQHSESALSVATREHATAQVRPVLLLSGRGFGTPQGLALTAQDSQGFTLTWRPVAGAVRYIVTRQGPTDAQPVTLTTTETGTTLTDMDPAFWNDRDYTYTVTAVHADGTLSDAATLTRPLTRTVTRLVTADTFIQGGANGDLSYGLLTYIYVKGDAINLQREALFRVADIPAFERAEFRVRMRALNPGRNYEVVLREMPDTGWTEDGAGAATWNSVLGENAPRTADPAPGDPSVVGRFTVTSASQPGDELSFDITALLKAARARGAATFVLHMFALGSGGENMFSLYSLQGITSEFAPRVVYTVPVRPSPGTLMILR